jgi:hypothetical protein
MKFTDVDEEREWFTGDRAIGANVAILRGDTPQKQIAEKMSAYGIKWTQTTVWEIEKGRRSLKAKEARYLAEIFGVSSSVIIGDTEGAQISKTTQDYAAKLKELRLGILSKITEYESLREEVQEWSEQLIEALKETRPEIGVQFELPRLLETARMPTSKALQQEAHRVNSAAQGFKETGVHTVDLDYLKEGYGFDSETS